MKIVYSDKKSGRSAQAEVSADISAMLMGKRIGDTIEGELVGLSGYKLKITGGSESSGFPMYKSVQGYLKTAILRDSVKKGSKAVRRKTVVGGVVSNDTAQINAVIIEYGAKSPDEIFPKGKAESNESA